MSGEKNTNVPVRDLSVKQGFKLSKFLVSWEMVLIYILLLINVVLMVSRTNLYFYTRNDPGDHSVRYGCMPARTRNDPDPDARRYRRIGCIYDDFCIHGNGALLSGGNAGVCRRDRWNRSRSALRTV